MTRILFRILFCTLRVIAITALIHLVTAIRDSRYHLLLLALAGLIAYCLAGCSTAYERAHLRFANDVADTTYTTITTTIPRDSVVKTFKTDTTRYFERIKQGRATVTIIREPTNTTVIANCDSLTKKQQVPVRVETQQWGIDPSYRKWKYIAFGLIGLFMLGMLLLVGLFFLYRFVTRNFSIARKNGTAAESN